MRIYAAALAVASAVVLGAGTGRANQTAPAPVATASVATAGTEAARLDQACAGTLGLNRSELPYDSCVRSLRYTLATLRVSPSNR